VVDKPHVLDDATLNRVFDLYDKQLDDQQQHYPPSSVLRRHPTLYDEI